MNKIILVTGGCKSGKTRMALELAQKSGALDKIYLATCVPHDDEMNERVLKHQAERGDDWLTVEEALFPEKAIKKALTEDSVMVLDCLTLWLTNLLMENMDEPEIFRHWAKLGHALLNARGTVILVSNEVGAGIVPENRLARKFRDLAGMLNQEIAKISHQVIWMVSGMPVMVKGESH